MAARISLDARQLLEFQNLDPKLKAVVLWVLETWPAEMFRVTSIYRTAEENAAASAKTTVHVTTPHRALDGGIRELGNDYQAKALALAKRINRRWIYDPKRPTLNVAYARAHGTGPHVHLQVHPNTEVRT